MKNQFHIIPAEIRKTSNKRSSKVCILPQLLGTGCKIFLHYTMLKYKFDCMHATPNDYCMLNAMQHIKINRRTYLSSRHIGLSWTICRLTFGPTRSRMLSSPYLIIVGLQENWKCIRYGSKHFCNKCNNHLALSTSVIQLLTRVQLIPRLLMSYIYTYIYIHMYIWSTNSWCF
jgi:hypothetical protein